MSISIEPIVFIIFTLLTISIQAEVYTAVTDLEDALDVEKLHIDGLKAFVDFTEQQLTYFKWKIKDYTQKNNEAIFDVDDYLSNPLNVFLLVKRVTSEWKDISEKLSNNIGNGILKHISTTKETLKTPDFTDLQGIAGGIAKLQNLYNLNTGDMVDGLINGIETNLKMTARDCFDLAVQMYNNKNYPESLLWLEEASDQLEDEHSQVLDIDIKVYVAMNHLEDGNITFAQEIINEILAHFPENELAIVTREEIQNRLGDHKIKDSMVKQAEPLTREEIVRQFDKNKFETLCRNGTLLRPKQMARLTCHYQTNNNPFLKIGPMKVEEFSLNPYIVVYHDLIYDDEIDYIKDAAKPKLKRSTTSGTEGDKSTENITNRRTSKSAFLDYNPVTEKIYQRISAVTGLSMEYCEQLQVVNYGIGGHYSTHYDFFPTDHSFNQRNRISTLLIYMSDVKRGGATVFPYLDVAIQPVQGSAVFWYNIQESGDPDYYTRHGACPVLYGSKWIANLWTKNSGQELNRLCKLKESIPPKVFISGIGMVNL